MRTPRELFLVSRTGDARRGAGIHGDVLNVHTDATHTHRTPNTHNTTQHNITHNITRRQTETGRDRERRQRKKTEKEREEKTEEER